MNTERTILFLFSCLFTKYAVFCYPQNDPIPTKQNRYMDPITTNENSNADNDYTIKKQQIEAFNNYVETGPRAESIHDEILIRNPTRKMIENEEELQEKTMEEIMKDINVDNKELTAEDQSNVLLELLPPSMRKKLLLQGTPKNQSKISKEHHSIVVVRQVPSTFDPTNNFQNQATGIPAQQNPNNFGTPNQNIQPQPTNFPNPSIGQVNPQPQGQPNPMQSQQPALGSNNNGQPIPQQTTGQQFQPNQNIPATPLQNQPNIPAPSNQQFPTQPQQQQFPNQPQQQQFPNQPQQQQFPNQPQQQQFPNQPQQQQFPNQPQPQQFPNQPQPQQFPNQQQQLPQTFQQSGLQPFQQPGLQPQQQPGLQPQQQPGLQPQQQPGLQLFQQPELQPYSHPNQIVPQNTFTGFGLPSLPAIQSFPQPYQQNFPQPGQLQQTNWGNSVPQNGLHNFGQSMPIPSMPNYNPYVNHGQEYSSYFQQPVNPYTMFTGGLNSMLPINIPIPRTPEEAQAMISNIVSQLTPLLNNSYTRPGALDLMNDLQNVLNNHDVSRLPNIFNRTNDLQRVLNGTRPSDFDHFRTDLYNGNLTPINNYPGATSTGTPNNFLRPSTATTSIMQYPHSTTEPASFMEDIKRNKIPAVFDFVKDVSTAKSKAIDRILGNIPFISPIARSGDRIANEIVQTTEDVLSPFVNAIPSTLSSTVTTSTRPRSY